MQLLKEAECPTEIDVNGKMSNTSNDEIILPNAINDSEEKPTIYINDDKNYVSNITVIEENGTDSLNGSAAVVENKEVNEPLESVDKVSVLKGDIDNTDDSNIVDICVNRSIDSIESDLEVKCNSNTTDSKIDFDKENDNRLNVIDDGELILTNSNTESSKSISNIIEKENIPVNIDKEENSNSNLAISTKNENIGLVQINKEESTSLKSENNAQNKDNRLGIEKEEIGNFNTKVDKQNLDSSSIQIDKEENNDSTEMVSQNKENSCVKMDNEKTGETEIDCFSTVMDTQNQYNNIVQIDKEENRDSSLEIGIENENNTPVQIVMKKKCNSSSEINTQNKDNEAVKNCFSTEMDQHKYNDILQSDKEEIDRNSCSEIDIENEDNSLVKIVTEENSNSEINTHHKDDCLVQSKVNNSVIQNKENVPIEIGKNTQANVDNNLLNDESLIEDNIEDFLRQIDEEYGTDKNMAANKEDCVQSMDTAVTKDVVRKGENDDVICLDYEMEEDLVVQNSNESLNEKTEDNNLNENSHDLKIQVKKDKVQNEISNVNDSTSHENNLSTKSDISLSNDEFINEFTKVGENAESDVKHKVTLDEESDRTKLTENNSKSKITISEVKLAENRECDVMEIDDEADLIKKVKSNKKENVIENDVSVIEKENEDYPSNEIIEICAKNEVKSEENRTCDVMEINDEADFINIAKSPKKENVMKNDVPVIMEENKDYPSNEKIEICVKSNISEVKSAENHKCDVMEIDNEADFINIVKSPKKENVIEHHISVIKEENKEHASNKKLDVFDKSNNNSSEIIEVININVTTENSLDNECAENLVSVVSDIKVTPKDEVDIIPKSITDNLEDNIAKINEAKLAIIDHKPKPGTSTDEVVQRKDKVSGTIGLVNNLDIISDEEDNSNEPANAEMDDDVMLIDDDDSQDRIIIEDTEIDAETEIEVPSDSNISVNEDSRDNKRDSIEKIKSAILNDFESDDGEIIFEDIFETTDDVTNEVTTVTSKNTEVLRKSRKEVYDTTENASNKNDKIELETKSVMPEENSKNIDKKTPSAVATSPKITRKQTKIFKKSLKKMSRSELEQFAMRKIVEALQSKMNIGTLEGEIEKLNERNEELKSKYLTTNKQIRDLNIVVDKLVEDLKKNNIGYTAPMRITRSVGLQVLMYSPKDSSTRNLNNQSIDTKRMLPDKELNLEYFDSVVPVLPENIEKCIPATTRDYTFASPGNKEVEANTNVEDKTPTPKIIPKPKPVAVIPEPVQTKVTNGPQQTHNIDKRPISDAVTVDLTDDEPPPKQIKLVQSPSVSVTSPRQVYIPIAGPRATRPFLASQIRSPVGIRLPQNTRLKTTLPRHPGPLPEARRVNTPGYKLIPPAPDLKISKIENGIVVSWKIEGFIEPKYEEIASYQLFAYQESSASPSTSLWKKIGDVKALPLPMACTLTQFMSGFKYYFAVRAVDVRSRIGPFSLPGSILLLSK